MPHKQVKLLYPFTGKTVSIDAGMKDLMQSLWDHGIETLECCEENGNEKLAYIVFKSGYDFSRFIRFLVYGEMKGFNHWQYYDGWNVKFEPELIKPLLKLFEGGRRAHG